jgi:hypothetical protein
MSSSSSNTVKSCINPSLGLDNSFSYSSSLGTKAFGLWELAVKFNSNPFADS